MSKSISLLSALLCTFIWGTTFIAQDTGMDNIGPFTFNAVRFFVGFLAIIPLVVLFELKNFRSEFKLDKKTFIIYSLLIGLSLFLGSALQQVALLYTDVANAAFFTIFYVPMVPIIIFLFGKKSMHWSVWPSVVLCLIGGYLLTNFHDATVRLGDTLVVLGALFWSTHIIFTGIIVTKYNLPLTLGAVQTLIVAIFSFIIGIIYEEFILSNILMGNLLNFICRYIIWWICICIADLCSAKYYSSSCCNNFFTRRCICDYSCLVYFKSNS